MILRSSFHAFITKTSLTEMQAITSTPLDFSSADLATNPGTCFWEQVGVKAPGTAKRMAFLDLVRSETVVVWTSPAASR